MAIDSYDTFFSIDYSTYVKITESLRYRDGKVDLRATLLELYSRLSPSVLPSDTTVHDALEELCAITGMRGDQILFHIGHACMS